MSLNGSQLQALGIVERCASALSLLGVATIIVAFSVSPHFRNPMQRLALLNAFFNLFDVTLTMISISGPLAGNSSPLCQLQGFLNQMFPLADVLWTLAMALDVYFVVFRRYDNNDLRKLEPRYIAAITAFTFIPAFVFLWIKTPDKGPMYGSVTLWCAIAPNWLVFRIAMYYAPIWASILVTIVLYCMVGYEILKQKRDLNSIGSASIPLSRSRPALPPDARDGNTATVSHTVDVRVQSVPAHWESDARSSADAKEEQFLGSRCSISTPPRPYHHHDTSPPPETSRHPDTANSVASRTSSTWHLSSPRRAASSTATSPRQGPLERPRSALSFRQYVVMPLMFFVVLLAVWVAPTTNRVASFVNPSFSSFPLLIAVGAMGSLRGFWNGVVFVAIGMKGLKRRRLLQKGRSDWSREV